jgi:hypothetical protein
MAKDRMFALRMETRVLKALERIGKERDRSVSWLIRSAAEKLIAEHKPKA